MKKVIILPLDGYKTGQYLLTSLKTMLESDVGEMISHIKINDGVHNHDMGGPELAWKLSLELNGPSAKQKIGIFLDLKIFDVSATLINTINKYAQCLPNILTVSSACSVDGIAALRRALPDTKLAMVSVLTDISAEECLSRYGLSPELKIYNDLENIRRHYKKIRQNGDKKEPFDLIVASAHKLTFLKRNLPSSYGYIVPGIRDKWMARSSEHQKRTIGVKKALELGATYVVMGAQLTKGNPEQNVDAQNSRQLTREELNKFFSFPKQVNSLTVLKDCGGYYKCLFNDKGTPLGPLVGYAGTYADTDGEKKNFVGYEYFNFAKAETDPIIRDYFASLIIREIKAYGILPDKIIGAPMGGILLATEISRQLWIPCLFAEKKISALSDPAKGLKETSELVIERHKIYPGDLVILIEDVCNNFSTTKSLQTEIEKHGGKLVAIACAINRSGQDEFEGLGVLSPIYIPSEQFTQEDPRVKNLIDNGQVVWKPKLEWDKLHKTMLS